jgi:hypothetical protein
MRSGHVPQRGTRAGAVRARTSAHFHYLAAAVLAVILLAVGACRPSRPNGTPPDSTFVIPAGAAVAQMRGEAIFTLPGELHLVAGQSVVIVNNDQAMHYFFDVPIAPGHSLRMTFNRAGTFRYRGALSCSIASGDDAFTVIVSERGTPR